MRSLQDMKQSGFQATLLVDPIDDFAIGGIATDRVAQQLTNTRIIVQINRTEQFGQLDLQNIPRQVIFVGTHDHRMLSGRHVVTDQQLLVEFFTRAQASELDRNVAMQVFSERTLKPDKWIIFSASSTIFTGSPMSRTNTSPPCPMDPA